MRHVLSLMTQLTDNCVYWAANNPRVTVEKEVNLPGVTAGAEDGDRDVDHHKHMIR